MNREKLVLSRLGHTWFIDLDGTMVKHNGYRTEGRDVFLEGAREFLESIPRGDTLIFLTSREEKYIADTEEFLRANNISFRCVIGGLPYGERILINDRKPSGLITARAFSPERDRFDFPELVIDPDL